ncbi:MAG TPA: transcription termination/antitermination NusG family protein [Xanthobacteraceae bacterium]|jgi:hypothetical protein|nr:transcription termination/antitermination NusG family protein [Xanthobacteraceae bacterium]
MLANDKLNPDAVRLAEERARAEWGDDWRSKKLDTHFADLIQPEEVTPWEAFREWHALIVSPNREIKAAERLINLNVLIYLPVFSKQAISGLNTTKTSHRLWPIMPGLMFAPTRIMNIQHRDPVMKWAGVRDFIRSSKGLPAVLRQDDIERIRKIEAQLNLPPPPDPDVGPLEIGDEVEFRDRGNAEFLGSGKVFKVANESRIGVEVTKLFGRVIRVWVPASELTRCSRRIAGDPAS